MKTGVYNFTGIEFPVSGISMKEMHTLMSQEDFESFVTRTVTTGGFWMTEMTAEALEAAQKAFEGRVSDELHAGIAQTKLGPTICCAEEFADKLTSEELYAVLKHEEAHVVLEHLKNDANTVVNKIVLNEQIELEADAYAVQAFGKEAMRSAILKLLKLQSEIFALGDSSKTQEQFFQLLVGDPCIQIRLTALC